MAESTIVFLNMTGDVTITWDDQNEAAVLALVQKKMNEGYTFFILKPRFGGLLGNHLVPLKNIEDARAQGKVVAPDALTDRIIAQLDDADLTAEVSNGRARIRTSTEAVQLDAGYRAKSARDVLGQQAVAVRPIVAG